MLGHLVGPLHRPAWRGLVTSITGELAKELRDQIEAIAEASGLQVDVRQTPTPGRIYGPNRCRVDFLAADKATGHGRGADLAIIDEAGLLGDNRRRLFNAVASCVSARDGRLWAISIQGDGPMFREMGERAADPAVVWHCYRAPDGARLDDRAAWRAANPGLASVIKSLRYMEDMSRRAIASPADAPEFRAYDLNLPQDPGRETIVLPEQWDHVEAGELPDRDGEVCVGLDLGGSSSMTAAAACWPETGRLEVWGAFPAAPELLERSRADGVGNLYPRMQTAGELLVFPGVITPVAPFLEHVAKALEGQRVVRCGADRYRRAEVTQAMADAELTWPLSFRSAGAKGASDMAYDVRSFQKWTLAKTLHAAPSMLLRHAIAESSVMRDQRANPSLDKARQKGRIDVLSASIIAVGLAETERNKPRVVYHRLQI